MAPFGIFLIGGEDEIVDESDKEAEDTALVGGVRRGGERGITGIAGTSFRCI